jgi:hypothetical protein
MFVDGILLLGVIGVMFGMLRVIGDVDLWGVE